VASCRTSSLSRNLRFRTYVDQRKIVVAIGERTGGKLQDALT